jgi:uncharacterized membrane protein YdjX (TVP38/TMEM64 family)
MTRFLKNRITWLLVIVGVLGGALIYVYRHDELFYEILFHLKNSRVRGEELRAAILSYGFLAPLIFIGVQILQVILAPIPGEASGALGGYIFGGWLGFVYSTVGLSAGSWIAFAVGRLLSDLVRERLEHTKVYHKFNHLVSRGDFVIPFVLFIFPGFPKDSLSYMLGLSHMPLPVFLFVATVGRIPGTLLLSFQGAEVYHGNYLRLALLLLLAVAITLPCYLYRKNLLHYLGRYSRRTFPEEEPEQQPGGK